MSSGTNDLVPMMDLTPPREFAELLRLSKHRHSLGGGGVVPPDPPAAAAGDDDPPASPTHSVPIIYATEEVDDESLPSEAGGSPSFSLNPSFSMASAGGGGGSVVRRRMSRSATMGGAKGLMILLSRHQEEHNRKLLALPMPVDLCMDKRALFPSTRQHRESARKLSQVRRGVVHGPRSLSLTPQAAAPTEKHEEGELPGLTFIDSNDNRPSAPMIPSLQCELCEADYTELIHKQPTEQQLIFWCFDCFPGQLQCQTCCSEFHSDVCCRFTKGHRMCIVTSSTLEVAKQENELLMQSQCKKKRGSSPTQNGSSAFNHQQLPLGGGITLPSSRLLAVDYVSRVKKVQEWLAFLPRVQEELPPPPLAADGGTSTRNAEHLFPRECDRSLISVAQMQEMVRRM